MSIRSRAAVIAAMIAFAAPLAAYGDSEAEERKAFIGFLQDINSRSGIHFVVPTAADAKAFGPYLQHYAIIMDYDNDMKGRMDGFAAAIMKLGYGPTSAARSIEQMAAAPQDLVAAKNVVDKTEQGMKTRLAKANADR